MPNIQLLNNVDHKNLRVITDRSAEYGDNQWFAPTFAHEFRNLQSHYPIVFTKNPETGQFQAVALLGFEVDENLYLTDEGWDAMYIPLSIVRQPFLIGFQQNNEEGVTSVEPVISVNMDSPRISETQGEPVFLEHGGNSEYLEQINSLLKIVHEGHERNQDFVDMLLGMDLLESFVLDVELNDGSEHRMSGFYTINETSLRGLTGDDLVILNNNGYLEAVYMAIASLANISTLVEKKNRKMGL
ncbi:MAG: SapC family protein [Xanthomonadales bacterium]|jgi:hypothetical protein|nr:SapC family protein [Xanthomonadales bacterium]MDH3923658.1 SapC family protein [Xanthomonadales bacterium]MDH3939876.1 SapC family protein [Xanthomonadales bacterium]MDH3999639.1 SapC family protein [Xanthomonadales bacterium]